MNKVNAKHRAQHYHNLATDSYQKMRSVNLSRYEPGLGNRWERCMDTLACALTISRKKERTFHVAQRLRLTIVDMCTSFNYVQSKRTNIKTNANERGRICSRYCLHLNGSANPENLLTVNAFLKGASGSSFSQDRQIYYVRIGFGAESYYTESPDY